MNKHIKSVPEQPSWRALATTESCRRGALVFGAQPRNPDGTVDHRFVPANRPAISLAISEREPRHKPSLPRNFQLSTCKEKP
jgi:hypothetical protein